MGVIWDTSSSTTKIDLAVVIAIFSIGQAMVDLDTTYIFLIGYLTEIDATNGFPTYKPCTTRVGRHSRWQVDCVFAEAITGIAQVVRNPALPSSRDIALSDIYYGLPSVFGAYTLKQDMKLLRKFGEADEKGRSASKVIRGKKDTGRRESKTHDDDDEDS